MHFARGEGVYEFLEDASLRPQVPSFYNVRRGQIHVDFPDFDRFTKFNQVTCTGGRRT